jgi:hypothetical protein
MMFFENAISFKTRSLKKISLPILGTLLCMGCFAQLKLHLNEALKFAMKSNNKIVRKQLKGAFF